MNTTINDDDVYTADAEGKQVYNRVRFSHLTAIDITLEKADDRLTDLSSTVNGVKIGNFSTVEEGDDYVKKHWVPNNSKGYVADTEPVWFFVEGGYSGKGVWVTEMSFYYDF